jgi:hypothetical protein
VNKWSQFYASYAFRLAEAKSDGGAVPDKRTALKKISKAQQKLCEAKSNSSVDGKATNAQTTYLPQQKMVQFFLHINYKGLKNVKQNVKRSTGAAIPKSLAELNVY